MQPQTIYETAPWVISYYAKNGSGFGFLTDPDTNGTAIFAEEDFAQRACTTANKLWPEYHHEVCKVVLPPKMETLQ